MERILNVGCLRCRELRELRVFRLAGRIGGRHTVGDVVPRLRCSRCGEAPDYVPIRNRLHRVILLGPGAYS